jgi:hypothetical protein
MGKMWNRPKKLTTVSTKVRLRIFFPKSALCPHSFIFIKKTDWVIPGHVVHLYNLPCYAPLIPITAIFTLNLTVFMWPPSLPLFIIYPLTTHNGGVRWGSSRPNLGPVPALCYHLQDHSAKSTWPLRWRNTKVMYERGFLHLLLNNGRDVKLTF